MSAATRGFELPLTIVPTSSDEIKGIIVGARLIQKNRICGSSQEAFSEWYVKEIKNDLITIAPIRSLEIGCRGIEALTIPRTMLFQRFQLRTGRVC